MPENPDIEVGSIPRRPQRKTPPKSRRRSDGMKGNQNAAPKPLEDGEEHESARRKVISLSLSIRRQEMLRNAVAWHEGYVPEDEQVEEVARSLSYAAIDQYCKAIERENDAPMIF